VLLHGIVNEVLFIHLFNSYARHQNHASGPGSFACVMFTVSGVDFSLRRRDTLPAGVADEKGMKGPIVALL